ncbi:MAG TPA: cytochrome c3 family protein [Terriglobia bacterium]|nr:cytochrome c3 family protein [Terriglobia bacterium]
MGRRMPAIFGFFLLGSAAVAAFQSGALGAALPAEDLSNDVCLACHSDPSASTRLGNGKTFSLYVSHKALAGSVHAGLACTDCHSDITTVPHPTRTFADEHAVSLAYYQVCKQCHFDEYSRLLDDVHYAALAKANENAPTCVDCHGSHAIAPPAQPRSRISKACARCHTTIADEYVKSVHGKALIEQGNNDVPVCTDCHHAHDTANPLSASWHLQIPQLCAGCHANKQLMAKYGISTEVLSTFLNDFHGMTASLQSSEKARPREFTATCTDCHGVHDIRQVNGEGLQAIKVHLLATCRRCHIDASPNFPSAWVGHYEPSLRHSPLVYGVKLFYAVFIPFVIGGLVLQILLHLWRAVVNR